MTLQLIAGRAGTVLPSVRNRHVDNKLSQTSFTSMVTSSDVSHVAFVVPFVEFANKITIGSPEVRRYSTYVKCFFCRLTCSSFSFSSYLHQNLFQQQWLYCNSRDSIDLCGAEVAEAEVWKERHCGFVALWEKEAFLRLLDSIVVCHGSAVESWENGISKDYYKHLPHLLPSQNIV